MDSFQWGVIFASLIFSAFFSGMEIAFISSNKLKIELDGKQGDYLAKIISNFQKRPSRFIGTMLVGNNIALVVYGIYMAKILEPEIARFSQNELVILIIQTIFSTLIILVTAEFLPKTMFRINPNNMLRVFAFPLFLIYYVLLLPMLIVIGVSEWILRLFTPDISLKEEINFGRIDLEYYIKEGTENNKNQEYLDHEIQIFQNALDFSKVKARDCLIPRTEVIAMDIEDSIENLRQRFVDTGMSKILIYRDNIDNIIGYTHSFELFKKPESIKSILLPVPIIAISTSATEILEIFIEQRKSIAVVVDEFGGTSGILTIEDIIEEIFGEIEDEHDKEDLVEEKISETEYLFSARLEVDYLNDEYKLDLTESDNYETLAGLIIDVSESIPALNEEIVIDQFVFTVKKVFQNKIDLVHLKINKKDN
ncbi:MAG: HlyC/CorC family transporter [Bacteroidetes bacterium]|nr:MAG: HlyC/CorC family transporter [Bacteroidota bacterium]MBL1143465.1 HlyC/CorC family transporter [Bacteroidota bacterium]NOG56268.1 HlyC/CorC family transporter [Bacteroidota bacterium]